MDHLEWIAKQMNAGKTWNDLKNISEDELVDLRDYQAIIPYTVGTLADWKKIVEEREKSYVERVQATGLFVSDSFDFAVPTGITSSWRAYKNSLKGTMSEDAIQTIEDSSHWILNQLTSTSGTRKGLVMGSVQSGKTANMVGLISMAADYDWNFFIILSGSIDNLRRQTRDRFKRDLRNTDSVQWHVLDYGRGDDYLYDFCDRRQILLDDIRLNSLGNKERAEKYVMVCLKQSGRLEKLIKWLHSNQSIAGKLRLVVIDDEADQASINTKLMENAVDEEPENDVERTRINQSIVHMVSNCLADGTISKCPIQSINYISYTATPYANILNEKIEGFSLYPNDFIFSLPEPKAYFGAKVIFGSHFEQNKYPGLNIVRGIGAKELSLINSCKAKQISLSQEDALKGLGEALAWFFCAAAVMRLQNKKRPISMLIHTSPRVITHMIHYELVFEWLNNVNKDDFMAYCKEIYEEETQKFKKTDLEKAYSDYLYLNDVPDELPEFDKISGEIKALLNNVTNISLSDDDEFEYVEDGVHLCVDNSIAQRYADEDTYMRIVYPDSGKLENMEKSPVFIVFGGNTLSRGLTIEGLVCTYFARNVSQADTLMQMARWFGYRRGYELLQRIWLSEASKNNFQILQQIDEELKKEFNKFVKEKRSPREFGPKIINSESISRLKITAKNRMQAAVETGRSYEGDAFETTRFREDDLNDNIFALNRFIAAIGREPERSAHSSASLVWRSVDYNLIMTFIDDYKAYDDKSDRILRVIDDANREGKYLKWNVAIVSGGSDTANAIWEPYDGYQVKKSRYSKIVGEPDIDITRLRDSTDILCDVDPNALDSSQKQIYFKVKSKQKGIAINASRGQLGFEDIPLLLIYRIDKDAIKGDGVRRESIKTKEDVIAYAIVISGDGKEEDGPSRLSIS